MSTGSLAFAIGITAVILFGIGLLLYWIAARRNRRTGGTGFVQHSRLTCPKCQGTFDYDWVPGMALTAVRLGAGRYMACPLCHEWSVFNVTLAPLPPPSPE